MDRRRQSESLYAGERERVCVFSVTLSLPLTHSVCSRIVQQLSASLCEY